MNTHLLFLKNISAKSLSKKGLVSSCDINIVIMYSKLNNALKLKNLILLLLITFSSINLVANNSGPKINDISGSEAIAATSYADPFSGSNTISCGTAATLSDHAGAVNYSNNANGYTVITAGTSTIRIYGSYVTESGYDYIYIYDGSGTSGTLIGQYSGTGSIDYTGLPGQTLTVRFTSDGADVYSGFLFTVDYSGTCGLPIANVPSSGSNTINNCSSNQTLLQDPGGASNYGNSQNGYTVLDAGVGGTINIKGRYNLEACSCDYIKIYNGSGTGGTLLKSYTNGIGAIDYTGTVGQTMTVQFTSDANTVTSGFGLYITYSAPTTGSLSNAGPINFCDASGNWSSVPISVSGQTGSVVWQYGMSNGGWSADWITAASPGYCCFPKKVSSSDGNADRIRYRVQGGCVSTSYSSAILIQNRYNEAPTTLTSSSNVICSGTSVTLTANFPSNINILGTVEFFSGSCGGTLLASVTAGNNVNSVSTTIIPSGTTTYFARYNPGAGSACGVGACSSTTVTVNTLSSDPTSISGTSTICNGNSTTLTMVGGADGTGASIQWFSGLCGGTSSGTGNSITVSPTSNTTYFVRRSGTCNTTNCVSQAITVNTLSSDPTSISGTSTICNGTSTTLTISGGADGTGASTQWFTGSCGGTSAGTGNGITVAPTSNTTYFVRRSGTCNTTNCVSQAITVNTLSSAPTSIIGNNTVCYSTSRTLTAAGGTDGTNATYEWFAGSCGGASAGTGSSISVSPLSNTTYYVRRTGTCNTTVCASQAITVLTPDATGLVQNDYIWSGTISDTWSTAANWFQYNTSGTTFTVPINAPDATTANVYIRPYGCGVSSEPTISSIEIDCHNLNIGSGTTLVMTSGQTLNVAGNWTNSGGTFECGNGTVVLKGNAAQAINSAETFYNLTIANTGTNGTGNTITLNKPITVAHQLSLNGGIIKTDAINVLTLNDGSESTSEGSNTSFVDGPMRKIGNSAFVFPSGDIIGSNVVWAPIEISNGNDAHTVFSAEYHYTGAINNWNPWYMSDSLDRVSGVEYWDLNRVSGSSKVKVTLHWKDALRSNLGASIEGHKKLRVAHWNANTGLWENYKAAQLFSNGANAGHITSKVDADNFSPFTLGTLDHTSTPLPVSLISFNGKCEDGKKIISWQTATETNNAYFTLERSFDGLVWEFVAQVNGAGNSNQVLSYAYTDNMAYNMAYYQLKQTDYNGQSETFAPIIVSCNSTTNPDILVYPNPFTNIFNVELKNIENTSVSINIYDIIGKKISKSDYNINSMFNGRYIIDMGDLPVGLYYLELKSGLFSKTTRLIKNK